MRPTARAMVRQYTESLEGRTRNPYVDVKGLVTVSFGVLIDPIHLALDLPWFVGDRPATHAEIRDDWQAVKALKERGENLQQWTARRQEPLTKIRLSDEGVDQLMVGRLEANIIHLRKLMPAWDTYPADAQLAAMSLAWARGAGFNKGKVPRHEFLAACLAEDWRGAKAHCLLDERGNAGVIERNKHQLLCLDNAANVKARGIDPSWLWWPRRCPESESLEGEAVKAIGLVHSAGTTDPERS